MHPVMKRKIQLIFIFVLILVLLFWVGDLILGVPAQVSDRAATEGWVDNRELFEAEITKSRLYTLGYAIPALVLFIVLVKGILKEKKAGR
jgi:hypothetical protein